MLVLFGALIGISTAGVSTADAQTYSAAMHADAPVSYWRLGETSGTTAADDCNIDNDECGNNGEHNNGTYQNSPTLGATSLLATDTANKAVSFDGTNDSVKVPNSSSLQFPTTLTLEAWIKPTSLPSAGSFATIINKTEAFALQFNGPRLELRINQGEEKRRLQAPEGAIVAGQTYHVVGTYDGSAERLYVNGTLVAGAALTGSVNTNSNALYIGSSDGSGNLYKGTIDEPAVYNTALNGTRIGAHYEAGSGKAAPPPSAPAAVLADAPVSYWRLGETSGTTASDERSNNPGTYQNSPTLGATSLLATDTANKAVSFDGTNDSVKVPNSSSLQFPTTLTLEAWIKPTSLPSAGSFATIINKTEAFALQFNGPRLELRINQGEEKRRLQAPEGAIVAGQTYHVVGTYDGSAERLYVNGTLVAGAALTGSVNTNSNALYIGSSDGSGNLYKGTIDEPAVYNTALNGTRIGAHYEAGSGKAAPPPPQTTLTSPHPTYTSGEVSSISFASDQTGSTFKCSLDSTALQACTSSYALPSQLGAGWHTFTVVATDTENKTDPTPATWTFNPAPYPAAPPGSKLTSPEEGRLSTDYFPLEAEWIGMNSGQVKEGTPTGVTFQLKLDKWTDFKTIPAAYVINGEGKPVSWPLPVTSIPGHTEPVYFNFTAAASALGWGSTGPGVKLRAVFDGDAQAAGASEPVSAVYAHEWNAPTDAVEGIGPVNVDLRTGMMTLSRTDVSIPVPGYESNLEFTRVYNSSRTYAGTEFSEVVPKALGEKWSPSAPVEAEYEAEAWQKALVRHEDAVPAKYDSGCVHEEEEIETETGEKEDREECLEEYEIPAADWVEVLDNEGAGLSFDKSGESYISPEEAKEYTLTKAEGHFVLADPNGTHTVFTQNGTTNEYQPSSISFQGMPTEARMVYDVANGERRLKMIIAPSQVTCKDVKGQGSYAPETAGCRTLYFQYNENSGRLESITYYNASGNAGSAQVVASYAYNSSGQLAEEWDPRTNLKEKYTYEGRWLKTLTPPGTEPWEFAYLNGSASYPTPLTSVSRASLLKSPSKATTTIAYGVPLSGSGAPNDMSLTTIAKWGQTDYPVYATAVLPPGHSGSEYSYATIHYLDPEGREVNTASPSPPGVEGASITTAETDAHGNVVRELSAQNRLVALKATDTVARSKELDSHSVYSADGTEMLESWSPLHKVRRENGETVEARAHTTISYDEGFQGQGDNEHDTPPPHLPTKETVTAAIPGVGDVEPRVTKTGYNWELRKPSEVVVDPEGLNLISKTVYNSSGQVIQERQPSNTEGGTAGTTKTIYWTAGVNSEISACGMVPAWAGLPCMVSPAANASPAESNPRPTTVAYDGYTNLGQPKEIVDINDQGIKRTTTMEYDAAGRLVKAHQSGEGFEVPAIETTYSSTTGAPLSQQFVCEAKSCSGFDSQQVTTSYDALGRPIEYKDADGNVSGVGYDLLGRPAVVSDGKGIQEFTFDEKSGVTTKLADSAAGTFQATYNADGQMTEQLLPDGLAQRISYDPADTAVSLRYEKQTFCSSACTWLSFSREDSIGGQVLWEESTLGNHGYSYDKAGRLTLAKEFGLGGSCTTRSYALDQDSNRTSLTTRGPKANGACDTESAGTKTSYSYDTADRLIGEGVEYDGLGRITSLPAKYSGGGKLTTSYYVNDLTHSQTQDGITNTYNLDASLRERERVRTGGSEAGTEIYHYATGSDSPAWTQEGTAWSRNIAALDGSLGAIQRSNGEVTLQLANMHGDVVASASIKPEETKLLSTEKFDEFGNPVEGNPLQGGSAEYGWLGSKGRRTQLPSGVIQMGARSYVPTIGRFISTDPVSGGSANAYDYANADPINSFDFGGLAPHIHCDIKAAHPHRSTHSGGRRVNAQIEGDCRGRKGGRGPVKVVVHSVNLYRNGRSVSHAHVERVAPVIQATPKKDPVVVARVNAPCETGFYRATAKITLFAPPSDPAYAPPSLSGTTTSKVSYVECGLQ